MPDGKRRSWTQQYKIKVVETPKATTRAYRECAISEAGFDTFLLRSGDVYVDFRAESGTNTTTRSRKPVRLTFPRRVHTRAHCDATVESGAEVWEGHESVRGFNIVYELRYLCFFQARFERL